MPVYETLEDAFVGEITLLVVNARHMKNVPGKKTDVRDSVIETVTVRASSVILHSRKTGLKNFYKAPVFVCLPLFLIYLLLLAGTSCYT